MHQLVLDPLELRSTGFPDDPGILEGTVPVHVRVDGTIRLGELQPEDNTGPGFTVHRVACPRAGRTSRGGCSAI